MGGLSENVTLNATEHCDRVKYRRRASECVAFHAAVNANNAKSNEYTNAYSPRVLEMLI